ncbi:MAG: hypothetical protein QOJ16_1106 [Acidobacteriota bacterium]|nr:hypothetical protein [Acidobacteriota bacterium]
MREVWIYVEGGGDGKESKAMIRKGFSQFFGERRVRVVACGSRNQTFKDFALALKSNPTAVNLLLVDSEEAVSAGPWHHLWNRDRWEKPSVTTDEHCHLMVQTVESWLVADPVTLAFFYGPGFLRNSLPAHIDIEAVPKTDVMKALDRATSPTQKGKYKKIAHCSALLARLDREQVRRRAKHCDRLLKFLEQHLS